MVAKCCVPSDYKQMSTRNPEAGCEPPEPENIVNCLRGSAEVLGKALIISENIKQALRFQDSVPTEVMEVRDMESQVYDIFNKAALITDNLVWIERHLGV